MVSSMATPRDWFAFPTRPRAYGIVWIVSVYRAVASSFHTRTCSWELDYVEVENTWVATVLPRDSRSPAALTDMRKFRLRSPIGRSQLIEGLRASGPSVI